VTLTWWKRWARELKQEIYALYLAHQDPRLPWYARLVAIAVVGYALSPIDLIPDPIPVLGYLDDLILIPLGVALAIKLIPPPLLVECREKAAAELDQKKPVNRIAGGVIIAIWLLLVVVTTLLLRPFFR